MAGIYTQREADYRGVKTIGPNGEQVFAQSAAGGAAVSNAAASASNVNLLAASANRRGAIIFNDADKALYIKFGATASLTSFTMKIAAGGYYELPVPVYQGQIDGIWDASPTGAARVTELS